MQFDTNRALYLQIADELRRRMINGSLKPGERIMPVRQFAAELGVTPNTLQRAFQELERENLLYTDRTSGRFVSEDRALLQKLKRESIRQALEDFVETMIKAVFSGEEIIEVVEQYIKETEQKNDR